MIQLPAPGSDFGPCSEPCAHDYCAAVRSAAEQVCFFCGQRIGFGAPFFRGEIAPGVTITAHAGLCVARFPETDKRPNSKG